MGGGLGFRLYAFIGAIALLVVGNVVLGLRNTRVLHHARLRVEQSHQVVEWVGRTMTAVRDAETGQRGFLITGNESYLAPYHDALKSVGDDLNGLETAARDAAPNELERVARARALIHDKIAELEQTIGLRRTSGFEAARQIVLTDRGREVMDALREVFAQMRSDAQREIRQRNEEAEALRDQAYGTAAAGGLLAMIGLAAVYLLLRRHLESSQLAARELFDEKELYDTTLRSIGDGVITTDQIGQVAFLNTVAEQLTGWTTAEARGRPLPEIFRILNESTRATVEDPALRALREGVVVGLANHTLLVHRDGRETPIDDSAAPIRDSRGRPRGTVLVFRNISERKAAEQARHDADRRKDEFLATLAHELRNPLAPLQNALHILRVSGANAGTVDRITEMMERQLDQMVRLVDDLLDVSRITRNVLPLTLDWIEVGVAIRDALELSSPGLAAARHTLTVSPPSEPVYIKADRARLTQALSNLLSNAAKYTPPGGQVTLSAREEAEALVFSVKDNGVGIPPEMRERIFEMFAQVDRSLDRSQGGLGIGLSLVRRIVELHGGTITVASEGTNQGSEFVIRLPHTPSQRPPVAAPHVSPSSGISLRLVVADDNRDSADTLTTLLQLMGHRVSTAYDGADALQQLEEIRPDAAFLDLGMPKVDGHTLARLVRESEWGKTLVLIALTGWGQAQDKGRSAEAGFNHHLVKPVAVETLDTVLASIQPTAPQPPQAGGYGAQAINV